MTETMMINENTEIAIHAIHLVRRFRQILAVNDVSFIVNHGHIFGLLGPNGAGKTTIVRMLTTLLAPTSGTALIDGYDIKKFPALVRAHIGYVPQLLSADGALTGYENLMLSAQLYNLPTQEAKVRIQDMLELMELSTSAHHLVRTYSGGMIRKLEIAQALLHRPGVLFLDEPTIGLDPLSRQIVWDRLRQLTINLKLAVLITTHDMEEAEQICHSLAILHHGKIVIQGEKAELKKTVGPQATLSDVFTHYCSGSIEAGGGYHNAQRTRKTIQRLD